MNRKGSKWIVAKDGEPYQNLANAIVYMACMDLREALGAKKLGHDRDGEIYELKKFFYSQWFSVLTTLDGDMVYSAIEKEFE